MLFCPPIFVIWRNKPREIYSVLDTCLWCSIYFFSVKIFFLSYFINLNCQWVEDFSWECGQQDCLRKLHSLMSTSKFSTSEINCSRFFLLTFRKKSYDTCGNVRKESWTNYFKSREFGYYQDIHECYFRKQCCWLHSHEKSPTHWKFKLMK